MAESLHPAATHHLPPFISAPSETDVLMVIMAVLLALAVLGFGILFLRIHSLPERMAHRGHKLQFEIVAVFGLICTLHAHAHLLDCGFAARADRHPRFRTPLNRIAGSAEKMAGLKPGEGVAKVRTKPAASHARAPRTAPPVAAIKRGKARSRRREEGKALRKRRGADPCLRCFFAHADDTSGLSLPALCPGQALRQGDHVLFRVVRAEMGHHDLPDPHHPPDHRRSSTTTRPRPTSHYTSEPSRSFPRRTGAWLKSMSAISGEVTKGAPIFRLDSSKQEAARRDRAAEDCRSRCRHDGGAGRYR